MSVINDGLSQVVSICSEEILNHLSTQDLTSLRGLTKALNQLIDEYVRHKLSSLHTSNKAIRPFFAAQEPLAANSSWKIFKTLQKVFPTVNAFQLTSEDVEARDLIILKDALIQSNPHLTGLVTRKDTKAIREWFSIPANQTKLSRIKILNLSEKGLCAIPKEIKFLTHLEDLNLMGNFIQEIPDDIFDQLKQLKNLNLCCNQIEDVNDTSFRGLDTLQTLELAYNRLKKCPSASSLGLQRLKTLQVNDNPFQAPAGGE